MIEFAGRAILLDVEGTTSAVAYVYDVMFPFAHRRLESYVATHWDAPQMQQVRQQVASDGATPQAADDREEFCRLVREWMESDAKVTGLKQLQGVIWQEGFESGELRSHVFPDVPPALARWHGEGIDLRIYSSGSVHAQKLFFAHTEGGDLLKHFTGHYDTTTGPKRDSASYARIAEDWQLPPAEVLFLSDVVEEIDAARQAGLATALVERPGNAEVPPGHGHPVVSSFDQIAVTTI